MTEYIEENSLTNHKIHNIYIYYKIVQCIKVENISLFVQKINSLYVEFRKINILFVYETQQVLKRHYDFLFLKLFRLNFSKFNITQKKFLEMTTE